jgi:membrane dipeptidase
VLIIDAHLDLAWNAIDWNRDLRLSVADLRKFEKDHGMTTKGRGCNTVTLPELRRGKIGVCIATVLARHLRPGPTPGVDRFTSMEAAYGIGLGHLAYYRGMEQEGHVRCIKDWSTLQQHAEGWLANGGADQPLGIILSMEGADPVLRPEQLPEWYDAGLRLIGPAHYGPSPYARGHNMEGGLFPHGPAFLKEMERVGIILDVTHLSDQCFDEALDIYGGPVLASHHNCRALVPDPRQLTDAQIKKLIARGGVIGAALDAWMLYPGWVRGETTPEKAGVTLETMVDHIDHVCQLAGNARHAAIGSDLDGGFGTEQTPKDLDTIADLQRLPEMLRRRGYDGRAIEGIMHGNWLRFFREAWKGK